MTRRPLLSLLVGALLVPLVPAAAVATDESQVVTGEVQRLVFDDFDGSSHEITVVVPEEGEVVRVEPRAVETVPTGAVAEVTTGALTTANQDPMAQLGGAPVLDVAVLEETAEDDAAAQGEDAEGAPLAALVDPLRVASVLVTTLPQQASDGVTVADLANDVDVEAGPYWSASTDGAVSFASGGQAAPATYSGWGSTVSCTNSQIMGLLDWSAQTLGVYPTVRNRRHTVTYTPRYAPCGFAGVAHVGDGGSAWINGPAPRTRPMVVAHELGHTLNLGHSNTRYGCVGGIDAPEAQCSNGEYGDAYDVMGTSGYYFEVDPTDGPISGAHLANLGLLTPSSSLTVTASRSAALAPVGALSGTRFLRYAAPSGATYVVEYRAAVGADANLTQRYGCPLGVDRCGSMQALKPGVLVRRLDTVRAGSDTALLAVAGTASSPRYALTTGESFTTADGTFTVTVGALSTSAAQLDVVVGADERRYVPSGPTRVYDARGGIRSETPVCIKVTGTATGIPADASGVALNVASVSPAGAGHLVVYPDRNGNGSGAPSTATLNFAPGRDVSNAAMVEVPANGRVCYVVRGGGSWFGVVIDVTGYFRETSNVELAMPQRLHDSAAVTPRSPVTVQVTGKAGVPAGATAVVLNVAGAGSTAPGNLRVWAADQPMPNTATLNYASSGDKSNATIVQLSSTGALTYYSETATSNRLRVVLDVVGYVLPDAAFVPVPQARLLDTRTTGAVSNGQRVDLAVGGSVPADAKAVVLNVVAVSPSTVGHLRVFPYRSGSTVVPDVAALNYIVGQDVGNMVVAGIGDDRRVTLYDVQMGGNVHLVADVIGYLTDTPGT